VPDANVPFSTQPVAGFVPARDRILEEIRALAEVRFVETRR